MRSTQDLVAHLELEMLSENVFQGYSIGIGSPHVFGGQVLAQAISAAYRTISNGRVLNSMHSYFLEPGNLELPIQFEVDILRDGGTFSTRRVTAKQNGLTIFILACSFHQKEDGHTHHFDMDTKVKMPEELMSWSEMGLKFGALLPKRIKTFLDMERPAEFKPIKNLNPVGEENLQPFTGVWFKLKGNISDLNLAVKQQILTYLSDYNILSVMFFPHASKAHWGNTRTASLDHSMWYFRDFDFDDWLLYSLDSPSTHNARGFCRGNIFTRDGKLVASVAQEGLMRPKN